LAPDRRALSGTAHGYRPIHRQSSAGHHGHPLHRRGDARRVRAGAAGAEGIGLWAGLHDLGSHLECGAALHQGRRGGRHHAGAGAGPGRDHGGDLRHRQRPRAGPVPVHARQHHLFRARQRVRRSARGAVRVGADRAGAAAVPDHLHRAGAGQAAVAAPEPPGGPDDMNARLYARRRLINAFNLTAAVLTTAFGLFWLGWLLWTLLANGLPWLTTTVFTESTPPPGATGGLANAIVGSLMMVGAGVLIGTPIGVLAGTYLAEFGQESRLAAVIRFVNDILLSVPSIIIGVFIYEVVVVSSGHFSGWAGALALSLIVVPIVVRTTENMLRLVPVSLREAAAALGAPMWKVVLAVVYRSARVGVLTGILLAIARISGETAPLLFTALNNQFWSTSMDKPLANLPVVIFQFAMSPYEDWQRLA